VTSVLSDLMPRLPDAEKRLRRIRSLVVQMRLLCEQNTMRSRARFRTIALEVVELLKAEDEYQRVQLATRACANVASPPRGSLLRSPSHETPAIPDS
jgi:hypothetical protein